MKKIPSVFKRDYDGTRLVFDEVVPGCEWVLAGEGVATIKFDGTCCLVRGGHLFKRHDVKNGKTPPAGWEPCEPEPNKHTGHWPGWLAVDVTATRGADKWHAHAWREWVALCGVPRDGTYELCGPAFQANPHRLSQPHFLRHGEVLTVVSRTFAGIRDYLQDNAIEGIVWHHRDGRMAKIKRRDFGFEWPVTATPLHH